MSEKVVFLIIISVVLAIVYASVFNYLNNKDKTTGKLALIYSWFSMFFLFLNGSVLLYLKAYIAGAGVFLIGACPFVVKTLLKPISQTAIHGVMSFFLSVLIIGFSIFYAIDDVKTVAKRDFGIFSDSAHNRTVCHGDCDDGFIYTYICTLKNCVDARNFFAERPTSCYALKGMLKSCGKLVDEDNPVNKIPPVGEATGKVRQELEQLARNSAHMCGGME